MRLFMQRLLKPSVGGGTILPPFFTMSDEKSEKRDLADRLLQTGQYEEAIILLEEIHRECP